MAAAPPGGRRAPHCGPPPGAGDAAAGERPAAAADDGHGARPEPERPATNWRTTDITDDKPLDAIARCRLL